MSDQAKRVGIEFISVFAQPPVEFVHLAADLGCSHIGLALAPFTANPHEYTPWSLREDRNLRVDVNAVLRDRGVSISLGEGFLVRPGVEAANYAGDLDIMRELGATRINALSIDPDLQRGFDQLGVIVALAAERGLETTLEFLPGMAIGTLADAIAAVDHVGNASFSVLLDVMHFMRSGGAPSELQSASAHIGYVQLCDAPLIAKIPDYGAEARDNRLAPGEGELPLLDILAQLPDHLIVGLEVPMLVKAEAGLGPKERLKPCVETARLLLEEAASIRARR